MCGGVKQTGNGFKTCESFFFFLVCRRGISVRLWHPASKSNHWPWRSDETSWLLPPPPLPIIFCYFIDTNLACVLTSISHIPFVPQSIQHVWFFFLHFPSYSAAWLPVQLPVLQYHPDDFPVLLPRNQKLKIAFDMINAWTLPKCSHFYSNRCLDTFS